VAILVARGQPEIADATGDAGAGAVLLAVLAGACACAAVAVAVGRSGLDDFRVAPATARIAVGAAVVVALLASVTVGRGPIDRGWDEFRNEDAPTRSNDPAERLTSFGGARYDAWGSAIDAFRANETRGLGPGSFEFWWAENGERAEFFRDAHSLYLEMLAELGPLGFALLLTLLGALLWAAMQARAQKRRSRELGSVAALSAAFVVLAFYAAVDWVWEVPALVVLGLGGAAVAGAAGFERWGRERLSPWLRWGTVAAAVLAFAVLVPGLVSTERQRASASELRAGNPAVALELARESVDAAPWAASPYVQRALAHEELGELGPARADLDEAIEREPDNWRHRLVAARVDAERGDGAAMQRDLDAARRLTPNSVFLLPGSPFLLELQQTLAAAR
jgi:tetratricopeptide (TPR) repeat protein